MVMSLVTVTAQAVFAGGGASGGGVPGGVFGFDGRSLLHAVSTRKMLVHHAHLERRRWVLVGFMSLRLCPSNLTSGLES
jgi:hypothetical protein